MGTSIIIWRNVADPVFSSNIADLNMSYALLHQQNPDTPAEKPKLQSYKVDLSQCGPMMLDALVSWIIKTDPSVSLQVDQNQERGRPHPHFPSFMP